MRSAIRQAVLPILAAMCVLSFAGSGRAAFPTSATVREGVGGGGVTIGMPIAQAVRTWNLKCPRSRPGDGLRDCQMVSGGRRFVQQVGVDQLGRVSSVTFRDPGFRTSRGIALGDRIAKLRSAYGSKLRSRITRVWSYFELDRRVGGQLRRTSFLGRTKVGDVVEFTVAQVRKPRLALSRPADGGLVVALTGWFPLADVPLTLSLGSDPLSRSVELGTGRTDRRGALAFRDPPFGVVDELAARRVPVTATVRAPELYDSLVKRSPRVRATVLITTVPTPPPPTLTVAPSRASGPDASVAVSLTGGAGLFVLVARWTCGADPPVEMSVETLPGSSTTSVSLQFLRSARFSPACVGATPPAELPLTLVLRSEGQATVLATAEVSLTAA